MSSTSGAIAGELLATVEVDPGLVAAVVVVRGGETQEGGPRWSW